ncbi:MAG: SIS domain-containing protein [Patescibacteria group bacterium]|nr:SIS domain-containing protein [Patescibacteria group bacterium]
MYQDYIKKYFAEVSEIAGKIDQDAIADIIKILAEVRKNSGRLFILGVGGGAGHAGHAVNDFRKLADIETYAPTDNVSELTARTNDDGWNTAFANWLKVSRMNAKDAVMIFSVGGGNLEKNISVNIIESLKLAKNVGAKIVGVVGRDGGYTKSVADACVVVPPLDPETVTPHTEAFQAVVWHCIVSHPEFAAQKGKWESVK